MGKIKRITLCFCLMITIWGMHNALILHDQQDEEIPLKKQLGLMRAKADIFKESGRKYSFAVVDLDQNGRLELIVSITEGTGRYTSSWFYEVNEAGDGLDECQWQERMGDQEASLAFAERVPVYYESQSGAYCYIYGSYRPDGPWLEYTDKWAVSLIGGQISQRILARRTLEYQDGETRADQNASPAAFCTTADGEEISGEEYENIADIIFSDWIRGEALLSWFSVNAEGEFSYPHGTETAADIFAESFNGFRLSIQP